VLPLATLAVILVATALVACGGARFDPTGPCGADGRAPGAYPDLERLVPVTFDKLAPAVLDSGRSCSPTALGSLVSHGVRELQFGGGQWHLSDRSGITMAVLRSPTGLEADWADEFYESSARGARHTENVVAGKTRIADIDTYRIETLNNETSFQTVVVWPRADMIDVVIVASDIHEVGRVAHDDVVNRAVAAFAGFSPG
jgi:hypothetical protein